MGNSTERYKLQVTKIHLSLAYFQFENRLRSKWLSTISSQTLTRNYVLPKSSHYVVKANSLSCRFSSIFSFSQICSSLVIFMVDEETEHGNWKNNPFSYKTRDIQSIQLFKSGLNVASNAITQNMNVVKDSYFHDYFYKAFLSMYGSPSYDIAPEQWYEDLHIYAFNLSLSPYTNDGKGAVVPAQDRTLSFIQGGTLDCSLTFNQPLQKNCVIHFLGYFDGVTSFTADGLPIDS